MPGLPIILIVFAVALATMGLAFLLPDLIGRKPKAKNHGSKTIFASLPGPDPSALVWRCPVADCSEEADGDMDSPFNADCCPVHPGNAFVLA
ncbi:hypothetical protein [Streptomyces sp. NPDC096311]|uniref:hypothetical protein n=1 Tax=Streptomyces sp. NPDC096311 TaxID=3366083 RepID=UPI0038090DB4